MNCKLVLSFLFVLFSSSYAAEVLLCDTNAVLRQYHVSSSQKCLNQQIENISTCRARLYSPLADSVQTPVGACTLVTHRWEGVQYFFGSKVEKTFDPTYAPVEFSRCQKIINSRRDLSLGQLVNYGNGYYATKNPLKPTFHWPSKSTSLVQNIVLMEANITYDRVNKKIYTPIDELKHCSISYGTCKSAKYTFIWNWSNSKLCPESEGKDVKLILHFATGSVRQKVLSYITIPEVGMTFYSRLRCPEILNTCFKRPLSNPVCLPNGEFLIAGECSHKLALNYFADSLTKGDTATPGDSAATFNFEHASMAEYAKNLTSTIANLECRLSNTISSVATILSKTHPSEVLSFLTQEEVGAKSKGDVLELLSCRNMSVNVLPTMNFEGQYVSRPLVTFFMHNRTQIAQFYPDRKAYLQIGFFEKYNHLHQATFFISGRYFTFQNYTLQKSFDKHIIPLHLNLGNPAASLPKINYENLFRDRPNREEVSNDFATLVSAVQQNRIFAEKMKTYFSDMQDLPSGHLGVKVDQLVSGNLSSYISCIRNPVLIFIILFLQIINHCWGVILLVFLIRELRRRCRSAKEDSNEKQSVVEEQSVDNRKDEMMISYNA